MRDFQTPGRSAVYAQNGMAATSHPLATKVALDTLQQGGNAVDAAVAAALMLPLCEPSATGLFGDAFALIKPAGDERIIGINGSGPAPAALSAAAMRADGLATVPTKDAHAVTLPGAVAAFERMLQDHGLLGWAEVAAPAIHYADAGVPVAPRVALDWAAFAPELRGAARFRGGELLSDSSRPDRAEKLAWRMSSSMAGSSTKRFPDPSNTNPPESVSARKQLVADGCAVASRQ